MNTHQTELYPLPHSNEDSLISIRDLSVWFNDHQVLNKVSLDVAKTGIHAIIGPSGSGKSTLLRCINRIHVDEVGLCVSGKLHVLGKDVFGLKDLTQLRQEVGMVFQKPCVFAESIEGNVAFGLRFTQELNKKEIQIRVRLALESVGLWDEVKNRLKESANKLSLGQQQRLCIARALAIQPKILLLDEPTSALDIKSSQRIEHLISELSDRYPMICVTHDLRQAERISSNISLVSEGEIIETRSTKSFFSSPEHEISKSYLNHFRARA